MYIPCSEDQQLVGLMRRTFQHLPVLKHIRRNLGHSGCLYGIGERHASASAEHPVVDVSVNGKHVQVPEGVTVLEACRALKIHVRSISLGVPPTSSDRVGVESK